MTVPPLSRHIGRFLRLLTLTALLIIPPFSVPAGAVVDDRIDINSASDYEFMTLDGIDDYYASLIIQRRQELGRYSSAEELIPLIGPDRFDDIKDDITIKTPPPQPEQVESGGIATYEMKDKNGVNPDFREEARYFYGDEFEIYFRNKNVSWFSDRREVEGTLIWKEYYPFTPLSPEKRRPPSRKRSAPPAAPVSPSSKSPLLKKEIPSYTFDSSGRTDEITVTEMNSSLQQTETEENSLRPEKSDIANPAARRAPSTKNKIKKMKNKQQDFRTDMSITRRIFEFMDPRKAVRAARKIKKFFTYHEAETVEVSIETKQTHEQNLKTANDIREPDGLPEKKAEIEKQLKRSDIPYSIEAGTLWGPSSPILSGTMKKPVSTQKGGKKKAGKLPEKELRSKVSAGSFSLPPVRTPLVGYSSSIYLQGLSVDFYDRPDKSTFFIGKDNYRNEETAGARWEWSPDRKQKLGSTAYVYRNVPHDNTFKCVNLFGERKIGEGELYGEIGKVASHADGAYFKYSTDFKPFSFSMSINKITPRYDDTDSNKPFDYKFQETTTAYFKAGYKPSKKIQLTSKLYIDNYYPYDMGGLSRQTNYSTYILRYSPSTKLKFNLYAYSNTNQDGKTNDRTRLKANYDMTEKIELEGSFCDYDCEYSTYVNKKHDNYLKWTYKANEQLSVKYRVGEEKWLTRKVESRTGGFEHYLRPNLFLEGEYEVKKTGEFSSNSIRTDNTTYFKLTETF